MAVDVDRLEKFNVGLSVKFEVEAQKVVGYSRKADWYWEFSGTTVALVKEYKVTNVNVSWFIFLIPCMCRKNSLKS